MWKRRQVVLVLCLLICSAMALTAHGDGTLQSFMSSDTREAKVQTTIQTAEMLTPFRGAGKYDISRKYIEIEYENATSQVYIYSPIAENTGGVVDRSMLEVRSGWCSALLCFSLSLSLSLLTDL